MTTGFVTEEDVRRLADICALSYCEYHNYKVLFEGYDEHKPDYGNIAPNVLHDIAAALKEHVILQVCKLADPKDYRGNQNISVQFFVEYAEFGNQSAELARLKRIGERLEAFAEKLKPARNKIIGHFDRNTIHDKKPLGAATDEEWRGYWINLESFVEILSRTYLKETIHIRAATATTDAWMLRGVLEERATKPHVPFCLPAYRP
jgi:AbiU2